MRYEILLAPEAVEDLKGLRANDRAKVRDAVERHLRHEPRKESRSRIKRLKGLTRPQVRLRVDEFRVFYDVTGTEVEILAVVDKQGVQVWLEKLKRKN
jgi:mRNA interferase RelE/StbE